MPVSKMFDYPYNSFLMLRREFEIFCQEEDLEVKILRVIEMYVENERTRLFQQQANQSKIPLDKIDIPRDVWVPISYNLFRSEIYDEGISDNTLKAAIKSLEKKKLIQKHYAPKKRYDPPTYRLQVHVIDLLNKFLRLSGGQKLIPSKIDTLKNLPHQFLTPKILSTIEELRVSKIDTNSNKGYDKERCVVVTNSNSSDTQPETPPSFSPEGIIKQEVFHPSNLEENCNGATTDQSGRHLDAVHGHPVGSYLVETGDVAQNDQRVEAGTPTQAHSLQASQGRQARCQNTSAGPITGVAALSAILTREAGLPSQSLPVSSGSSYSQSGEVAQPARQGMMTPLAAQTLAIPADLPRNGTVAPEVLVYDHPELPPQVKPASSTPASKAPTILARNRPEAQERMKLFHEVVGEFGDADWDWEPAYAFSKKVPAYAGIREDIMKVYRYCIDVKFKNDPKVIVGMEKVWQAWGWLKQTQTQTTLKSVVNGVQPHRLDPHRDPWARD